MTPFLTVALAWGLALCVLVIVEDARRARDAEEARERRGES